MLFDVRAASVRQVAYVITQNCCKDASCVPVCPVECIPVNPERVEGQDQLWAKYRLLLAKAA